MNLTSGTHNTTHMLYFLSEVRRISLLKNISHSSKGLKLQTFFPSVVTVIVNKISSATFNHRVMIY